MRILFVIFAMTFLSIVLNISGPGIVAQENEREATTIKLDPIADVNPVKTQHTMLATVLDSQGRPLAGQHVHWILSRGPIMVGDIVDQHDLGAMVGTTNEVIKKINNHYTITYTSKGPLTLDMGTDNTNDDISLGIGQTWITITSPVEGETHIVAFCPAIRNANNHKAFAVKYWIDAKITWPENATNKVGEEHTFKFNLIKASTLASMPGYLVKWTLIQDESSPKAHFGKEPGSVVAETETDPEGNAIVTLNEVEKQRGINRVKIELRKPTGELLAIREVTKTWISPDIRIVKKGPADGILEENVVFNVEITNPGAADAQDVEVRDKIEEGFEYVGCDLQPDSTENQELVWKIGVLPKDASRKFALTLKAKKVADLQNTAVVTSKEAPPQSSTAIVKIGQPDLPIKKYGTEQVRLGEVVEYKLVVKNAGGAVARDVVIKDEIPEGFTYGNKPSPMSLKWRLGELQPEEEKIITYSLKADKEGVWTNTAKTFAKDKEMHKATFVTTVVAPNLKLTKTGQRLLYLHKSSTYSIKIENNGTGAALNVQVTDTIPEHMEFISADPRGALKPAKDNNLATVTWNFEEIPGKTSKEIKIELRARKRGQCVNVAKLTSSSDRLPKIEPLTAELNIKIMGIPAMHISTYDTEDPCEVGKQTIYVIEVRNEGTSPCTTILMRDIIPVEMEFVEAEGSSGSKFDKATRMVTFDTHPILQPGDKLTFKIRCQATKAGPAKNRAILKYHEFEDEIIAEEGTSVYGE